jgi:hypothetical protein
VVVQEVNPNLSQRKAAVGYRMAGMEFAFKVSETEYCKASELRDGSLGSLVAKLVLGLFVFWVSVSLCLVLLWVVVQRGTPRPPGAGKPANTQQPAAAHQGNGTAARALLETGGPLIVFVAAFALALRRAPAALRRAYWNDPAMQGQFIVDISPQSISVQNTAGISSKSGWDAYSFWREGKGVIVLMARAEGYVILSLAGLSNVQRRELHGILASALPKK